MKLIQTKNYGSKIINKISPIDGTNGLFLAEMLSQVNPADCIYGVIDSSCREVVPFGELNELEGVRMISNDLAIIDHIAYFGDDNETDDIHGSVLCVRDHLGFIPLYRSDVTPIRYNDTQIFGAQYEEDEDIMEYRGVLAYVKEFTYGDGYIAQQREVLFRDYPNLEQQIVEFINGNLKPQAQLGRKPEKHE